MSNKTSNKNVANIEDDVKILRKFMNEAQDLNNENGWHGYYDVEIKAVSNAIEHILTELEQDKKRIQELEAERQMVGMPVKNKRSGKIGIVLHQWKSGSIAVLENINPRVINTHESWNTLEIITDEVKQTKTKYDSIPKQRVKEILDDIYDYFYRLNGPDEDIEYIENKRKELLEE